MTGGLHLAALLVVLLLISNEIVLTGASGEQKYQLRDPRGNETSFLYDGGEAVLTCTAEDPKDEIHLKENFGNEKKLSSGNGTVEYVLKLSTNVIGKQYICGPSSKFGQGAFEIKEFQCDPFALTPAAVCTDEQFCLIKADESAYCAQKEEKFCFLTNTLGNMKGTFEHSFPEYKYVCNGKDGDDISYGLCNALTKNQKNVIGISVSKSKCLMYKSAELNNNKILHGELYILTKDPDQWEIKFNEPDARDLAKIICQLVDSNYQTIATYETPEKSSELKLISSDSIARSIPHKLKLHCSVSDHSGVSNILAAYIILTGTDENVYKRDITVDSANSSLTRTLKCQCAAPTGLYCFPSWGSVTVPNGVDDKTTIIKTVAKDDIKSGPLEYTCVTAVYVVQYPASFSLIEIPDARKKLTRKISMKDFDGTSENNEKDPNATSSPSGNGSQDKAKSDEKKSGGGLSGGAIGAIVGTFIVLIIIILVAAMFLFHRRRKNNAPDEIATAPKPQASVPSAASHKSEKAPKVPASVVVIPKTENEVFLEKLTTDTEHLTSKPMLKLFHANMPEIVRKGNSNKIGNQKEGCVIAVESMDMFKRFSAEWQAVKQIHPEAGFLPTSRHQQMCVAGETWVFKDAPGCSLVKDIPIERDMDSPIKALNMNYLSDLNGRNSYILAQAPLEREMPKFFEVLFNKNIGIIITLLHKTEKTDKPNKVLKYYDYYDKIKKESIQHGDYTFECSSVVRNEDSFQTRTFFLYKKGQPEPKIVYVLSYLEWGDCATPADCRHISTIHASLKQLKTQAHKDAVTLIHCSGGLGRSGTLLAYILCIEHMRSTHNDSVNVFQIVSRIRHQRIAAVQTGNQYLLIFWALGEYFQQLFNAAAPKKDAKSTVSNTKSVLTSAKK